MWQGPCAAGAAPLTGLAQMQNGAPALEPTLRSAPCVQASFPHGTHEFCKRVIWALRNQVSQSFPERTTLSPGSSLGHIYLLRTKSRTLRTCSELSAKSEHPEHMALE